MKTEVLNSAKVNVMSSVSIREQLLSSNVVLALAAFFGKILEEEVSPVQALYILNIALSFTMLILLSGCGLLILCPVGLWFAAAVYQCLDSGISLSDENE